MNLAGNEPPDSMAPFSHLLNEEVVFGVPPPDPQVD